MGDKTSIQWCDATWNPVDGCTPVSKGCKNCYAARHAKRFWRGRKFCDVRCHPDRLDIPLKWKKPRRIFVCSMGDLFHEDVSEEFVGKVYDAMWASSQHTFIMLTKRPKRMLKWVKENACESAGTKGASVPRSTEKLIDFDDLFYGNGCGWKSQDDEADFHCDHPENKDGIKEYKEGDEANCSTCSCPIASEESDVAKLTANGWGPYDKDDVDGDGQVSDSGIMCLHARSGNEMGSNIYYGATIEDQEQANIRIPILAESPAAVRFVSVEPMLSPVDLTNIDPLPDIEHNDVLMSFNAFTGHMSGPDDILGKLDGVICGCESGPGARETKIEWVRDLRDQCKEAGVPFFLKQLMQNGKLVKMPLLDGVRHDALPEVK